MEADSLAGDSRLPTPTAPTPSVPTDLVPTLPAGELTLSMTFRDLVATRTLRVFVLVSS